MVLLLCIINVSGDRKVPKQQEGPLPAGYPGKLYPWWCRAPLLYQVHETSYLHTPRTRMGTVTSSRLPLLILTVLSPLYLPSYQGRSSPSSEHHSGQGAVTGTCDSGQHCWPAEVTAAANKR